MPNAKDKTPTVATIVYPDITPEDKTLYANVILVNHTPWDFALHFDRIVSPVNKPETEDDQVKIAATKVATIHIPITLVRGLIEALQTNLEHYESQYGEVTIPKKG